MDTMKIRVPSDKAAKMRKNYEGYPFPVEVIPTDLYSKKITHQKGNDLQSTMDESNNIEGLS